MNLEAVSALIAKKPSLKAATAKLEAMEPGTYVVHRSWGFGQIQSYDEAAERLIIDFKDKPGHPMDPAFCVGTMDVLADNHILARKQTEADHIQDLINKQPGELVVEALKSYDNHATTAIDLEITLAQVVGETKFKKWWTATKKVIAKDPRVAVPAKKTECYILRETPVSAKDELMEAFEGTQSARRRISIAEKLISAVDAKDEDTDDLVKVLHVVTEAVRDSNQITTSERLYGAAMRDDLAKLAGVEVETLSPTQGEIIENVRDLPEIAESIPVGFQSRFLQLIKVTHPIECRDAVFTLLKSSQGKFTTECINFLIENEYADDLAETFQRWQVEQNLRAPVLLWIVKNRHSKKFAKLLNELITPRLLSAIFFAIDYEALQAASARRIPLGDILSDDPDLIADLLSTADPENARDLANTLMLNQGFEELTKKSLLARFIKIFPNIQSLVAGDAEGKEEALLVSRESYERRREEYDTIVSVKIPENSKAIATAREHGDLKENSEYKMAKQDQTLLMAQKSQLEKELESARITDFSESVADQVGVGSIVSLKNLGDGQTPTYKVMGAWDSDPDKFIIAYKAPLGQVLLGKRVGEKVKIKIGSSEEEYEITKLERIPVATA
ncbi:MAG: transcription elongation factor GreAB [Opitutaceae bacterium]|jgi:transcription elongation factor GreA|nr:transcription elongation factor GreAB [Opitutaceae bacterium]